MSKYITIEHNRKIPITSIEWWEYKDFENRETTKNSEGHLVETGKVRIEPLFNFRLKGIKATGTLKDNLAKNAKTVMES